MRWIVLAIISSLLTVLIAAFLGRPKLVVLEPPEIAEGGARADLDMDRIEAHLRALTTLDSRVTGYPGSEQARDYILTELAKLSPSLLETQTFGVPVPMAGAATLRGTAGGKAVTVPLFPLWPNLARTCHTPPAGISGHLVDLASGKDEHLERRGEGSDRRAIRGSIAVMDWDSDREWLSVPELGGRAVLFRGGNAGTGRTSRNKFLSVPADIPRFYVKAEDTQLLDMLLNEGEGPATVTCQMSWEQATATNILAVVTEGDGTADPDDPDSAPLVFHAYYDSISVVPGVSPGAEQAVGTAVLLELARFFANQGSLRPVQVLFTGAHGQALSGMVAFVEALRGVESGGQDGTRLPSWLTGLTPPALFVGIDLSSRSEQFGIFCTGHFRNEHEHLLRSKFSLLGSQLDSYASRFRPEERPEPVQFIDCINLTRGRGWWTYFPYQVPFESEAATVGGIPGVTFATLNDNRAAIDTPDDTFEALRLGLLARQITGKEGVRPGLAAMAQALTQWRGPFVSRSLPKAHAELEGRVVWLDQERNYTPNEPLSGALVFLKTSRNNKHLMGTRGIPATMTDTEGIFRFPGLAKMDASWQFQDCALEAYGTADRRFIDANPDAIQEYQSVLAAGGGAGSEIVLDGSIIYGGDMAREQDYPYRSRIRLEKQYLNLVCFPCRAFSLLGLTDPRGYVPLTDLTILEATTKSAPFQYGKSMPDVSWQDAESIATLWSDPTVRILLTLGLGLQEKRLILINHTPDDPEGRGFALADLATVPSMVLQGARDMWNLDQSRIAKLEENGVRNPRIREAHDTAGAYLDEAEDALAKGEYRRYRNAAERGWSLEGKAYGETLSTINNMIRGVLFYLVLLLPSAYCLERLLVASGTIKKRIVWIGVVFSVSFGVLAIAHPAFRFTLTPFLVLLAFVIIVLVVTVSALIVTRMDAVLQERKRAAVGRHEDQLNLGNIAIRAIDLGISNIRRRPQRGFLTALTVVMVTFILLSFTSLVPVVSISRLKHRDGNPLYTGMMARQRTWASLPDPLHDSLRRNFGTGTIPRTAVASDATVVSARAWFYSDQSGNLSQIDLVSVDAGTASPASGAGGDGPDTGTRSFTAVALLCMQPYEPLVTGVDKALVAGRWFDDPDELAIILPSHIAEQLGYGPDDLGRPVRVFGEDLPVIGIFDSTRFDEIEDLDGEPLTPVDFVMQQQMRAARAGEAADEADTLEEYSHYSSDQIAVIPFKFGHGLRAGTRSIAVKPGSSLELVQEAEGYTKRSNLTVLVSTGDGDVTLYAALNTSQLSAAWQIAVPLFLGFVMVLGTMTGSVYERKNEIFVYNSVGLSPASVSSLFLSESTVYAIIGAGTGYLLGQVVSKLLHTTGMLSGVTLNYTAGSTVFVTVLTMAMVLISTIYPARQAYVSAMSDMDDESEQADPEAGTGDHLGLYLPFVATRAHVFAMQAYMAEYLDSLQGVTVGQLAIDGLRQGSRTVDGQTCPVLVFRAWLAPFDLGVSHDVELGVHFRADRGVYQYHLSATRFSGDQQNWRRLTPRFILILRKQLLMWRILTVDDRQRYVETAEESFVNAAVRLDRASTVLNWSR